MAVAADYPAYGSDALSALAGTTLDAFTRPDPEDEDVEEEQQNAANGKDDDGWDAQGLDGDRDGDDSVLLPNGDLPNTLEIVRAFDLKDFAVSPVTTVEFVPVQVMEKWAKVFAHIALALKDALNSPGPGHTRRIGEALRWYCGAPQIFLRSSSRGDYHRQGRHIEGRLDAFIGGNYTTFIGWWRAKCERAGRMRKPRKRQSSDQRWDHCVQQITRGFVGPGLKKGEGGGVGPTGARTGRGPTPWGGLGGLELLPPWSPGARRQPQPWPS